MEDAFITKDGKIIANKDIKKGQTINIDLKDLSIARELQRGKLEPGEEGEMSRRPP